MAMQKVLIAPLTEGVITNTDPWLIPNNAFVNLNNVYPYQRRLKKRPSTRLFNESVDLAVRALRSRLRVKLPNSTDPVTGNTAQNAPGAIFKNGQLFSVEGAINQTVFTIFQDGATLTNGVASATYNTATGALAITGNNESPSTPIFFYPSEPVMGIVTYEDVTINDERYFAFDTQFSYEYNGNSWDRFGLAIWTGSDTNFFWATNWRGVECFDYILFVVNYNQPDQIKFWNNAVWGTINPVVRLPVPPIVPAPEIIRLETARIIMAFQDRLICLNVIESTEIPPAAATFQTYTNRCRFSQNGSPFDTDGWQEDIVGKGGYIDAPTKEAIITAEFLKDRLIVYFERSTWELVYTNNQILPFIWQKINTELGCESTFSVIPFDKFVLGIGNVGIHACNGANVERIDEKIQDIVFAIHNNNSGVQRVAGIRDYKTEIVYWSIPDQLDDRVYPNRVLIYNYLQQAWAFMDESITAFGYFQQVTSRTWAGSVGITWAAANFPWKSGVLQAKFRDTIAGNQQGFMFYLDPDRSYNDRVRQITNVSIAANTTTATITCYNHNFVALEYVEITEADGLTNFNGRIFQIQDDASFNANTFSIITTAALPFSGGYTGNGSLVPVSVIEILTKRFNLFTDKGSNSALQRVEFLVNKTSQGQVQVSYGSSFAFPFLPVGQTTPDNIVGTGVLVTSAYDPAIYPHEQIQDKLWHPVYINTQGETFQLEISYNDEQITNKAIVEEEFELHAMCLYVYPSSSRLQ